MLIKTSSRMAATAVILGLAGLTLAFMASCKSSSSPAPASQEQSTSTSEPSHKLAPIVGSPEKGKELFAENCTTCHGMQGQGVHHLGADLQTNEFVASSTDAQVVAFIERGITADDPQNMMHAAMPPKGGNPGLTTQDLYDIVAFIRQIQRSHAEKD